jgi:hypothetical protein
MRKLLIVSTIVLLIITDIFGAKRVSFVSGQNIHIQEIIQTPQPTPSLNTITSVYIPLVNTNYNPCPVYTFLDYKDLERIRTEIQADEIKNFWEEYKTTVDDFIQNHFPTEYNNTDKDITAWYPPLGNRSPRAITLVYLVTGDSFYGEAIYDLLDLIVSNTPPRNPNLGPESGLFATDLAAIYSSPGVIFAYSAIRNSNIVTFSDRLRFDSFFLTQVKLF